MKNKVDWQAVDWKKDNSTIAIETNYSVSSVANARRVLGKKQVPSLRLMFPRTQLSIRQEWLSADWNKSDEELAMEKHCCITVVRYWRERIANTPREEVLFYRKERKDAHTLSMRGKNKGRDWFDVDWTKQDVEIAAIKEVTRERARQVRRKLGKPNPENYGGWTPATVAKMETEKKKKEGPIKAIIDANRERFKTIGIHAIASELKMSYVTARKYLDLFQVERADDRIEYDWSIVNFDLPTATIEEVWEMSFNLAASKRSKAKLQKPKWRRNYGGLSPWEDDDAYRSAVAAEVVKAKAAGKNPVVWEPVRINPNTPKRKSKLEGANFDLPNYILAEIYGMNEGAVSNWRYQNDKPVPKWRKNSVVKGPDYDKAVADERLKINR